MDSVVKLITIPTMPAKMMITNGDITNISTSVKPR
jgi:hypothetical protein